MIVERHIVETPHQRVMKRYAELKEARNSWDPHIQEVAENFLPRRLRLNGESELNRGTKLNGKILDSTPLVAQRILAAGLMASISSPARPWFRLTTQDPELADFGPAKAYLHQVEVVLRWVFSRSNYYQALCDGVYPDLGTFGTAAMLIEESPTKVLNCRSLPWGEYYLSANGAGEVDTCYREIPMTVRQVVTAFCQDGNLSRLSQSTKNAYSNGAYENVVNVLHVIEPNPGVRSWLIGPEGKKWTSKWLERGSSDQKFLRASGYDQFPVLAPRWSVTGGDLYGRGPGMDALPDAKELQHETKQLGQLIDKSANPPMKGSAGLRGSRASLVPGDITYMPDGPNQLFEAAIRVEPTSIQFVQAKTQDLRSAVRSIFFADLWLRILTDERAQRATATEIQEGRQELMLQLGPVLERLNPELLSPSIDRGYVIAERLGLLPEPPEELEGQELNPEFISILHQAQKATGLTAIRTLWQEAAFIGQFKEAIWDKMEADATIDEIADILGVNPALVLGPEGVARVRAARAQQEREAQAAQQASQLVQGAAALGKTPAPSQDNALGSVLQSLAGPIAAVSGGMLQ